ncbi:Uncharacterized protein APZ42_003021, partial [Daphnia magna]
HQPVGPVLLRARGPARHAPAARRLDHQRVVLGGAVRVQAHRPGLQRHQTRRAGPDRVDQHGRVHTRHPRHIPLARRSGHTHSGQAARAAVCRATRIDGAGRGHGASHPVCGADARSHLHQRIGHLPHLQPLLHRRARDSAQTLSPAASDPAHEPAFQRQRPAPPHWRCAGDGHHLDVCGARRLGQVAGAHPARDAGGMDALSHAFSVFHRGVCALGQRRFAALAAPAFAAAARLDAGGHDRPELLGFAVFAAGRDRGHAVFRADFDRPAV